MTESDSVLTKSHLPQTCNVFIQNCLAFPVLKSVLKIKEANNRNTCAGSPAAHREAGDALPGHCQEQFWMVRAQLVVQAVLVVHILIVRYDQSWATCPLHTPLPLALSPAFEIPTLPDSMHAATVMTSSPLILGFNKSYILNATTVLMSGHSDVMRLILGHQYLNCQTENN